MKTDTSVDHFDEMTEWLSQEGKRHVLDSLACVFHNEGYSLEGNTEHNDIAWLANRLSYDLHDKDLEKMSVEEKASMMRLAKACKDAIPALAERMAARYIRVSKAVRAMERIASAQKDKTRKRSMED